MTVYTLLAPKFVYNSVKNSNLLVITKGMEFNIDFNDTSKFYEVRITGDSLKFRLTQIHGRDLIAKSELVKTRTTAQQVTKLEKWFNKLPLEKQKHYLLVCKYDLYKWFDVGSIGETQKLDFLVKAGIGVESYIECIKFFLILKKCSKQYPVKTLYRVLPKKAMLKQTSLSSGLFQPLKDCTSFSLNSDIRELPSVKLFEKRGSMVIQVDGTTHAVVFDHRWLIDVVRVPSTNPFILALKKTTSKFMRRFLLEQEIILYTPKAFKATFR